MVSVEATFSPTLAGEKASVTVGGTGATVIAVGHAVAAVPADDGAAVVAPVGAKSTVAVSVLFAESVTVNVNVPAVPFQRTAACAALAPEEMLTPPVAFHA
jgi:hypothetical protein